MDVVFPDRHVPPNAAQSNEYQRSMHAMNAIASEISAKQDAAGPDLCLYVGNPDTGRFLLVSP